MEHAKTLSDADLVAREAVQVALLTEIFDRSVRDDLILKGGLALRTVHGSTRYTKDIDLHAAPEASMGRVTGAVESAMKRLVASGRVVDAKITAPKQTGTTQRWKLNGRLPDSQTQLHLTVEVSHRAAPNFEVQRLPMCVPGAKGSVTIPVLSKRSIAATKVAALTNPSRVAPRDLFDLDLLISAEIEPPVDLIANMGEDAVNDALRSLWGKIGAMTWEGFQEEVLSSVPSAARGRFTRDHFETMQVHVGSTVEAWLKQAQVEIQRRAAARPS